MILPVSNLQTKSSKNIIFQPNSQNNPLKENITISSKSNTKDSFRSFKYDITFKGRNIAGKYYTDQELKDAKAGINDVGELADRYGFFKYIFTKAPEKYIKNLKDLRESLNEEEKKVLDKKIKKMKKKKKKLKKATREAEVRNTQALLKVDYTKKRA